MGREIIELICKNQDFKEPVDIDGLITFLNPYSYLVSRKNVTIYEKFDQVFVDGILLVTLLRLVGFKVKRISFDMTSLAPVVFEDASCRKKSIYFVGGEKGVAEQAVKKIHEAFPNLKIAGIRNGFFNHDEEKAFLGELVLIQPDIVIVGMGAPLQEKFLIELKNVGWKGVGYTCGGFLHQTASKGVKYYPKWMDRLNLRWLYRMVDEPKLMRRYFIDYPKFVFVFFYDFGCYYFKK